MNTRVALAAIMFSSTAVLAEAEWMGTQEAGSVRVASSGNPGLNLGGGTLENGEKIWRDTTNARFVEVPAWMSGLDLVKPSHRAAAGTELYWDCPVNSKQGCLCYLFQYHCPGCDFEDGGLISLLQNQNKDWEKFYCAPKFEVLMASGAHHPMIGFRTHAAPGERVGVTLTAPVTEYVFIAGDKSKDLVKCSDKMDEPSCEDSSLQGQCEWEANTCINRRCISKWQGPSISLPGGIPGSIPKPSKCSSTCVEKDLPHGHM